MEDQAVSYMRQNRILDPNKAAATHVTICGCGTVGSNVAMQLAKAGFGGFTLIDMDVVESHNIPSQDFTMADLGVNKAYALKSRISAVSHHATVNVVDCELYGGETFDLGIVVLAVDSIAMRQKLYELSIRRNPAVEAFMDFRMGGNLLQAWFVDNSSEEQQEKYAKTLFDAREAVALECGGTTFAPVGALSGAIATQLLTKWLRQPWVEVEDAPPFYTYLDMDAFELRVAGSAAPSAASVAIDALADIERTIVSL